MRLSYICELFNKLTLINDGEFSALGLAVSKCDENLLSFIESEKYIKSLGDNISCLITTEELADKLKGKYGVVISDNPRMDYFKIHNILSEDKNYIFEKKDIVIGDGCSISNLASISNYNVKIGDNVTIEEFVVIKENTTIKDNAIIRAGSILGGEGYEFKRVDGIIMNVKHCGGVIVEENVEVQYNSCIDKALYTWDNTIVGKYSKLDNFVHLEHGVKVGARCLIASRTTVGGRTVIGDDSWIGLGAVLSNGLILGKGVNVSLGSVVTKNLDNRAKVSGNFAIKHDKYIDFIKSIR